MVYFTFLTQPRDKKICAYLHKAIENHWIKITAVVFIQGWLAGTYQLRGTYLKLAVVARLIFDLMADAVN